MTIYTVKGRRYWDNTDDEKAVRAKAVDDGLVSLDKVLTDLVVVKSGVSLFDAKEFVYGRGF